jgi:hypothetical protein
MILLPVRTIWAGMLIIALRNVAKSIRSSFCFSWSCRSFQRPWTGSSTDMLDGEQLRFVLDAAVSSPENNVLNRR